MIVVFDAHCPLCSHWARLPLKHDRHALVQFASIQGAVGRRLLVEAGLRPDGFADIAAGGR
ncbi:MAG: rane protein [Ramlibacter sp.]|uniref:DCC1-like thiol-disulfide oxidoreductase family protein n=1 Tax=Ramlibacter sp. TaxID=1917967 RepID=UPI00261E12EE|nr:DCC1-like thiol-disulfide oxidoreductase family protein [Ramlibacter sp.]MDB5749967.1 rane protein [Ramlibacter sp.]